MATHSSTLAWRIPWREEPGRLVRGVTKGQTRLSDFTHSLTHEGWMKRRKEKIQEKNESKLYFTCSKSSYHRMNSNLK